MYHLMYVISIFCFLTNFANLPRFIFNDMVFVLCLISCIYIPHDLMNILTNWYALHNVGW